MIINHKSLQKQRYIFFLGAFWWLLIGCRQAAVIPPAEVAPPIITPASLTMSPTTAVPATATTTSTPPAATPTVTATSLPDPTSQPTLIFAVPPAWGEVAGNATAQLNQSGSAWQWQVNHNDDPAAQLAAGQAQVAWAQGTKGLAIRQEPLALAVPFTAAWENVTAEEAQSILNNGHALAAVLPWAEMPPTHKALRVDGRFPTDPDYPLQRQWSLIAAPGYDMAATELAPVWQTNMPAESLIHLAAVGDIMLDRALGYALQQGDLAYPFVGVAELLSQADITVGNLECALGDVGQPAAKSYTFQAPPQAAEALALAGFDVVSLANNHAMDYGPESLLQGLSLLQAQGIATIGAGPNEAEAHKAYVREVNGLTLAFLGYVHVPVEARSNFDTATWTARGDAPGLSWADPATIQIDVTAIRSQADVVIVVLHSGYEYVEEPSPPQAAAAKAAIDAGADLVIGHHAHILQGIEFYNGGVIVYGLGNFAFEIDGDPNTAVLNVWLDKDGVRQLEIVPAIIQFGGQPRLAEAWEGPAIVQRVYRLTDLLNTSP